MVCGSGCCSIWVFRVLGTYCGVFLWWGERRRVGGLFLAVRFCWCSFRGFILGGQWVECLAGLGVLLGFGIGCSSGSVSTV